MTGLQKTIKAFAIFLAIIIILSIINALLFPISLLTNTTLNESKSEFSTTTYTNINKIEIDSIYANIEVKKGDKFKVETSDPEKRIRTKQVYNTLEIKEKKNWLFQKKNDISITIYIPQNKRLEKLSIDSSVGKVTISNIYSYKLDIDQGAGILQIDNSTFRKTEIDGGVGKITLTSSILNDLDLDAGVGGIDITSHITGDSKIDCGVGNININLLGTEKDYYVTAEKGLGSITINNRSYENDTTYGQGNNKIELEGDVGDINVSFKNISS